MRIRYVAVRCYDCGRGANNDFKGRCVIVEQRGLFGWKPHRVTFDRGGCRQAQHFPTVLSAQGAVHAPRVDDSDIILLEDNV